MEEETATKATKATTATTAATAATATTATTAETTKTKSEEAATAEKTETTETTTTKTTSNNNTTNPYERPKEAYMEDFTSVERNMGIIAYANPEAIGFAAVLKARYSDFVVHEVDLNGKVARLESLENNLQKDDDEKMKENDEKEKEEKREVKPKETSNEIKKDMDSIKDSSDCKDKDCSLTSKRKSEEESNSNSNKNKRTKVETDESNMKVDSKTEPMEKDMEESKPQNNDKEEEEGDALSRAEKQLSNLVGIEAAKETISMLRYWETNPISSPNSSKQKPHNDAPAAVAASSDNNNTNSNNNTNDSSAANNNSNNDSTSTITKQSMEKNYILPLLDDKEKRRSIHFLIRSTLFSPYALADTKDKRIRIWHRRFHRHMPQFSDQRRNDQGNNTPKKKNNKKDNQNQWPKDCPDYLRFILYKENIDTTSAVKDIIRLAKLNPRQRGGGGGVGYAGMKDKRGVTSQYCTIYRKTPKDLLRLNSIMGHNKNGRGGGGGGGGSTGKIAILRIGQFSYVKQELRLGMLFGNRFDIVLRNVCIDSSDHENKNLDSSCSSTTMDKQQIHDQDKLKKDSTTTTDKEDVIPSSSTTTTISTKQHIKKQALSRAAESMKRTGFINYFGMQRFGKYHDTHKVGIAILKGDFESAVNIIMKERPDEIDRICDARRRWHHRFHSIHNQKYDDDDNDDDKKKKKERDMRDAEKKCAQTILRTFGRFMTCEVSILSSLARRPRDYKAAFASVSKNMRLMFLHSYQSYLWNHAASHRIQSNSGHSSDQIQVGDLVLIEDDDNDNMKSDGNNDDDDESNNNDKGRAKMTSGLKGKSVHCITEQDLQSNNNNNKFDITNVVIPMVGTKISFPQTKTVHKEFFESLLKKDGLTINHFHRIHDRELTLCGDYRKLLCRPMDVDFQIVEYENPWTPLIQTDLMKIHKEPIEFFSNKDNEEKKKKEEEEKKEDCGGMDVTKNETMVVDKNKVDTEMVQNQHDGKDNNNNTNNKTTPLLGLIIGFTLPPSAYATIALRELMKRPTASEYQRVLMLEGECERNIKMSTNTTSTCNKN